MRFGRGIRTLALGLAVTAAMFGILVAVAVIDSSGPEILQTPSPTAQLRSATSTSVVATSTPTPSPTSIPTPEPTPTASPGLAFAAGADAQVKSNSPTNFGTLTTVRVKNGGTKDSSYRAYLTFTVTGLSGPATSTKLRLYVTSSGDESIDIGNTVVAQLAEARR